MKILTIGNPYEKLPLKLSEIIKDSQIEIILVTGEIPPVPFKIYYPKHIRKVYNSSCSNLK